MILDIEILFPTPKYLTYRIQNKRLKSPSKNVGGEIAWKVTTEKGGREVNPQFLQTQGNYRMDQDIKDELIEALRRRHRILRLLGEGIYERKEMVDKVSVSRVTVDRALRDLEDKQLVTSMGSDYRLTSLGRHSMRHFDEFVETLTTLSEIRDLLKLLPEDVVLEREILHGGNVIRSEFPAPDKPDRYLKECLKSSDEIKLVSPVLSIGDLNSIIENPNHLSNSHIFLPNETIEYLLENKREDFTSIITAGDVTVYETKGKPAFGLLRARDEVVLGFFNREGTLIGLLTNSTPKAFVWADMKMKKYIDESDEVFLRSQGPSGAGSQSIRNAMN